MSKQGGDDPQPSTSTAISAQNSLKHMLEMDELRRKIKDLNNLWRQKFDEFHECGAKLKATCRQCLAELRQKSEDLPFIEPLKQRLNKWQQGWQRVWAIYVHTDGQPAPLEWQIFKLGFFASLTAGFVFGGLLTVPESSRRFEVYAAGKDFGQIGFQQQRKYDYVISRFYVNGFRRSIWTIAVICSIVGLTLNMTAYRDKYSLVHYPISSFMVLSTAAVLHGFGVHGLFAAALLTAVPTLIFTSVTLGACHWADCSVPDGYRRLQQAYREHALRAADKEAEIQKFMSSRAHFSRLYAHWCMARERREGTWKGSWAEREEDNALVRFAEAGDDLEEK